MPASTPTRNAARAPFIGTLLPSPLVEDPQRLPRRDRDLDRRADVPRCIQRTKRHRDQLLWHTHVVAAEIGQTEPDRFVAAADDPVRRSLRFAEPDGEQRRRAATFEAWEAHLEDDPPG